MNGIAFAFWFTPTVDEKTGPYLGVSTVVKVGAIFTTMDMTTTGQISAKGPAQHEG
ncbi:hypothetical protein [Rothia sp. (in: high G+C Gram-positive bacteria)]|uniref:hypothetical protein n=1 Tax=unclassified Rothia (in: high G+C Gram-positive bacteria) TaxID=2689056 RepID=UPI00321648C8